MRSTESPIASVLITGGYLVAEGNIHQVREEVRDKPMQVLIRCDHPELLASRMFSLNHCVEARLHADGKGVFLRTGDIDEFYRLLNQIAVEGLVKIDAVAPADDDTRAIYQYLIGSDGSAVVMTERAGAFAQSIRGAALGHCGGLQARRLVRIEIAEEPVLLEGDAGSIFSPSCPPSSSSSTCCSTGIPPSARATTPIVLAGIVQFYYIRLGVFFGCLGIFSRLIRGEMIERSLHFYLLAPVRREILLLAKFAAGSISALLLVWQRHPRQLRADVCRLRRSRTRLCL